ncbi:MAG: hypothetical protein ACD_12C00299G0002 [uncultured bacterium]|nr:MAG: hypothetical protein ACD_12C00299G0002 [uncultured bacterium]
MQNKNNLTFGLILILISLGFYLYLFFSYKPKVIEAFGNETGIAEIDDQIFPKNVLENLREREVNGQLPVVLNQEDHSGESPFTKVE